MPLTLLVVDDEPDLALLIRQKFRRRVRAGEMDFVFASDGVEALAALRAHEHIDLVLTDINMPRMDGLTLLSHIAEIDRPIKTLMVSAYGDMDNIRTAMNRGAFDFVTKPINFDDLAITIDKTHRELIALRKGITLQKQLAVIQRDLDIARQIQTSALPTDFPQRDDVALFATMKPAREVGGDFYDFFLLDDDHLGIVLGDVSGKGLGAALFMAITRTLLRATALQGHAPGACLRRVNEMLFPESPRRTFVTLIYGILDLRTGDFTHANAGHQPPYLLREGLPPTPLARTGGAGLCLVKAFDYQENTTRLAPGDGLVFYTDGVSEAAAPDRSLFEEARLEQCLLEQAHDAAPTVIIEGIVAAVTAFAQDAPQSDDITVMAVRRLG